MAAVLDLDLPDWFDGWRKGQWEAVEQIVKEFQSHQFVLYNGPVGSGKSLVGEAVRQLLARQAFERTFSPGAAQRCFRCSRPLTDEVSVARGFGPECIQHIHDPAAYINAVLNRRMSIAETGGFKHRTAYLTTTIQLQEQLMRDFSHAKLIKGRSNYPTGDFASSFPLINCSDCDKARGGSCEKCIGRGVVDQWYSEEGEQDERPLHCSFCCDTGWMNCPYEEAKREALTSPLAVANLAYFLTEANFVQKFSERDFVVVDEAELTREALLSFVEVAIPARRMGQFRLQPPEHTSLPSDEAGQQRRHREWADWVELRAVPAVSRALERLGLSDDLKQKRERKYLGRLLDDLQGLVGSVPNGNWVLTGAKDEVRFKPVHVNTLAPNYLWKHGKKFLLMSGTIISPSVLAEQLGIEDFGYVESPWAFPVRRRPIYVRPVANMSKKVNEREKCLAEIVKIVGEREDVRVLVHSVSYPLTSFLGQGLKDAFPDRTVVWYTRADEKNAAMEKYVATDNAILVAPSMARGVDLYDDLARCVIIAKVPFPDLGDKQVSALLHSRGGQNWYSTETVRSIVQMSARHIRSEHDWGETFITDSQFVQNVYKKSRHLLPRDWLAAIDWYERNGVDKS